MSATQTEPESPPNEEGAETPTSRKSAFLNGSTEALLTPDLLFKMNKKIAQLTKVVYGLNTRGEELESQLGAARVAEEETRAINNDLQHRVNSFKRKIDDEMGKLRELENQATQAQIWKIECEKLQRRLESLEANQRDTEAYADLVKARDEIDQLKHQEESLHFELDQARHAIANLKVHHDFVMRESETQWALQSEKATLEWQSRCADLENRYQSQMRRLTADLEMMTTECDVLRESRKRAPIPDDHSLLRDQLLALQIQYDTDRREWEVKYRRQKDELEEQRLRYLEEKGDFMRKQKEASKEEELIEERVKAVATNYEEQLGDLNLKCEMLQELLKKKEKEFNKTLIGREGEWRAERQGLEDRLKRENRTLKEENDKLEADLRSKSAGGFDPNNCSGAILEEVERELESKNEELVMKSKNFDVRVRMLECENTRLKKEKQEALQRLEEEEGRCREVRKSHEGCQKGREDLLNRLHTLKDTERLLKETARILGDENGLLKRDKEDLNERLKRKEVEWKQKLENDVKSAEGRIKQKVERIWMDKLSKSEENSSYDVEKIQEANRRREEAFKRELTVAQQMRDEANKNNEELKIKIQQIRHREAEAVNALREAEKELDSCRRNAICSRKEKELAAQDQRYQSLLDDLSKQLSEKQREVEDLKAKLDELKDLSKKKKKEPANEHYELKLEEMKRQIREQEAKTESVRIELQYTRNENDLSKSKMRRLEEELTKAKETEEDHELKMRSVGGEGACWRSVGGEGTGWRSVGGEETGWRSFEESLRKSERLRMEQEQTLKEIEMERDEDFKIIEDALDEAAQEREVLILSFQKELEQLSTSSTMREEQMLEDFEWKLHEMEKDYKKKVEEKETQAKEGLDSVRSLVESELAESLTKVAEDKRISEEKLAEVVHLRSYEAEVIQLRGVTHEFQKALRSSAREMENSKIRERILNDEIRSLKKAVQSRQNTLQRAKRHAEEEEFRQKLENTKNQLNAEWEDRLRSECCRLKAELDKLHMEEKHLAVEFIKVQKDQEIQALRKSFEIQQKEMANDVSSQKESLVKKEKHFYKEIEYLRTSADREVWDLRMKLQKLNESLIDQEQQMEEKYREDLEGLRMDYEDRIRELEKRLSKYGTQVGVDVISKLEKEHKMQMQHVGEQHQLSLERLREELEAEKFQEVEEARLMITKHHEDREKSLREQLAEAITNGNQCRDEVDAVRFSLSRREEAVRCLEEEMERYKTLASNSGMLPSASSGFSSSQYSLASSLDSQGSKKSQDRLSLLPGDTFEVQDDSQKNSGLFGKVFGSSWFTPSRSSSRRSSVSSSSKRPYP